MMKKGEIWVVKLYSKEGREQEGIRPAIIIADTKTDLVLVIPLTSNLESLKKFSFVLKIEKSYENNLDKNSVALVFQLQSIDRKRLKNKIGKLEDKKLNEINNILRRMLNL